MGKKIKVEIVTSNCKVERNKTKRKNNYCCSCSFQFGNQTVFKLHKKFSTCEKSNKFRTIQTNHVPMHTLQGEIF